MRRSKIKIQLIGFALALAWSNAVFGQDGNTSSQPQGASNIALTRIVGKGRELKIEGIVIKRNADAFTMRESDGTETIVVLTDKTRVRMVRKGFFRSDRDSGVSDILRGLRLKAEGTGNADGELVAGRIRFDERDLRTAQALESRVEPVETLANSTQALAESNQKRIDAAEQNAQQLSGQVDELSGVASAALVLARNAQESADQAQADASSAHQRINGLDDYDVVATISVHFKPGSANLSQAAKTQIDEAAAQAQGENLKGLLVEVVGYADSTGTAARNRSLSERRADAVTNYLVTKHNLPLRRLTQPFGYGSLNPAATNDTRVGRALNRRVEIRVLANKGISSPAASQQMSYEDQSSLQP